jgi:hypothetical protein
MCDYSLMNVPNRLARESEELVVHRFPTGSLGLASPGDVKCSVSTRTASARMSLWSRLKEFFNPPVVQPVAAVCVPPGARLVLHDIPVRLQREMGVGAVEEVRFTQITAAANSYRDAVKFANGREVRLQDIREGQRVKVLDLSGAEQLDLTELREREELVFRLR